MLGILLVGMIASLLLLVEHWFPWQLMLRKELPRLAAYVVGVLAIVVPLSGLYLFWGFQPGYRVNHGELIALWVAVGSGGISVLVAHGVDELLRRLARGEETEELLELREKK